MSSIGATPWRAESDGVAVRIDNDTLVLAPVGVLRQMHIRPSQAPRPSDFVGIINPNIGSAATRPRTAFGHNSKVDLDAITSCEPISAALVLPCCKTKPSVILKRHPQIAHGEYWCDSLQLAHDSENVARHRAEQASYAPSSATTIDSTASKGARDAPSRWCRSARNSGEL